MTLPPYHFRIKENGALVFRVEAGGRDRRLELVQIATVNVGNGNVRPQGGATLSEADHAAIDAWLEERRGMLAERRLEEARRTVEVLNLAAHWAQSTASDAELEALTDPLLLAMHDLRSVLVRKKAERLDTE